MTYSRYSPDAYNIWYCYIMLLCKIGMLFVLSTTRFKTIWPNLVRDVVKYPIKFFFFFMSTLHLQLFCSSFRGSFMHFTNSWRRCLTFPPAEFRRETALLRAKKKKEVYRMRKVKTLKLWYGVDVTVYRWFPGRGKNRPSEWRVAAALFDTGLRRLTHAGSVAALTC